MISIVLSCMNWTRCYLRSEFFHFKKIRCIAQILNEEILCSYQVWHMIHSLKAKKGSLPQLFKVLITWKPQLLALFVWCKDNDTKKDQPTSSDHSCLFWHVSLHIIDQLLLQPYINVYLGTSQKIEKKLCLRWIPTCLHCAIKTNKKNI